MRLKDKVAIVTGAASGFGAETARLFAREGALVVVADLNLAGAKAVAAEIGSTALAIECDVSRRVDVDRLVAACIKEFAVPDIVVNNAGFTHKNQPLLNVDEALFDKVFAVNVKSIFHMVHAVVPHMRQRGSGVILNIGSTAGILETARKDPAGSFIIGTENGVTDILARELPLSHIYALKPDFICPDMKKTTLEDVLACFEGRRTPIELPQAELDGARKSLERMIAVQ